MILGDVVEEFLEGGLTTGIFEFFEDVVGEEAVMLVDEGIGGFVAVGGHENDNVVTHAGGAIAFGLFFDVEEGMSAALDTVETGINDECVAEGLNAVEPASEGVEGDALIEDFFGIAAFEDDVFGQGTILGAESANFAYIDTAGHEVWGIFLVADAVASIIEDDVDITVLGFDDVFEPMNALIVDFLTASVVEHLDMAGGNAEGADEIFTEDVAVVGCEVAVGQRCGVFFVGNDECVCFTVGILFCDGNVEVDIFVVEQCGFHALGLGVESAVHHNLQAAAAIVGTGDVEATGDEEVFVGCVF